MNQILVSEKLEFGEQLADYVSTLAKRKINITVPTGGIRKQIIELGTANGEEYLSAQLEKQEREEESFRIIFSGIILFFACF